MLHIGEIFSQFLLFFVLLGLIFAVYFGVRCLAKTGIKSSREDAIEEKLDKIIELLEKDKLDL